MDNQALISVIIPVYNVENYLHECVDSVINQTYKNLEIILVDDGSTDSSGRLCDEYPGRDGRITVIHQENKGLSEARNKGLSVSNGNFIYFLDSDDFIAKDALEKLHKTITDENADLVFFDAVSFEDSEKGTAIEQRYARHRSYKSDSGLNILSQLQKNKEYHSAVYLMFFDKAFLEQHKLSFVPGILYEDLVFTYQALCKAKKATQCNEKLYYRRYRPNSIMTSRKNKRHFLSINRVYEEVAAFSRSMNIIREDVAKEYICRCAFNVFNIFEKLNSEDKKNCRKKFLEFRKNVINCNAFGNKSLKMRCYGKPFWFIYKIFEKVAGKLLKGK